MTYKTYRLWKLLVVIIVGVLVGWAVPQGNAYIPIPAAVVAMVVLLVVRRGVKEVVIDERTYSIANRASRAAFQAGVLLMVLAGATLVALGYNDYPELETPGFTLIYSATGLLLIYLIGYAYFGRKYGGKE
jgi:uncharacterized membrane protein